MFVIISINTVNVDAQFQCGSMGGAEWLSLSRLDVGLDSVRKLQDLFWGDKCWGIGDILCSLCKSPGSGREQSAMDLMQKALTSGK